MLNVSIVTSKSKSYYLFVRKFGDVMMHHVLLFMISARRNVNKMVDRNVKHCVFKCHFTTQPSLYSLPMSSNLSALVAASAYVCHNPHCTSRRTSFASEKAFTMHCQRSTACLLFIRDEVHGSATSTTTTSHAASINNPIKTSTKQASLLRCEVINEQHVGDDTTSMDFLL